MSLQNKNWYEIENISQIDSPALVIYPERVKENIRILKSMVDNPLRLRPHIKTHKTKEVVLLMMEAGIQKFKCATIAEAEMLAMCKAEDVLFAYQPVGPKLQRFISLIKKYPLTKFSCLVDNAISSKQIADACSLNRLTIPVYIDLNVGQNRTGIKPGIKAVELYQECSGLNGIKPIGLHAYDGHICDPDFKIREQKCNSAFSEVEKMKDELLKLNYHPIIVAGGSPTFPIHSKRKDIECSPGTFIYWDRSYQLSCDEQNFLPAAVVISRVVSFPDDNKLCLDLGHKSVAAENELIKRVYFLNAPELKAVSQSEEHLVLETEAHHSYKPGDLFYGLPFHICPTCALYERAYTAEEGKVTGEWKVIARDRIIKC